MKLRFSKLPKSQKYICYPKILKQTFKEVDELYISMGTLSKRFEFDTRCFKRPKIEGIVVCSLSVSRKLTPKMCLYPIKNNEKLNSLSEKFVDEQIPFIKKWLKKQLKKSETEILGYEELLIELIDSNFKIHKLKFL